ncbi:hypothetical protein Y032_0014g2494 [Ancylostoma ceylanicum]|uniref:Anaphase-promoting complex subunit 4 WD40 domain-containing protein n=2 Tax=Ancylostoma ceylanicum TaxID=53326 RepID=A0A016V9S2_9BILA|nr:hypothetical protein Y032_0014g2494 [Ancylostoma ceylanicum]
MEEVLHLKLTREGYLVNVATHKETMLSDVTLHSLVIEPKKPPVVQYSEASTMTDDVKTEDKEVDPMERRSIAIGTEMEEAKASAEGVTISEQTITLFESMIRDSATSRIYDRLLPFHTTSLVQLQPIRTYSVSILSAQTLPVVSISCGSAGRSAILIGESDHETWCSHEGKVIISQRSKATSIPLAVCPSSSSWSPQGVLAVGDVAGDVHIVIGETIIGASKVHSLAVSSLEWTSSSHLVSGGADGNIIISQLKGTALENVKTVRLSVSDLPRWIRKSSSSAKSISIVSMARCGSEMCVATETGGLWIVSLPDLRLKTVPNEPLAIHTVAYAAPFIAVSGDEESTSLMNSDGTFIESFALAGNQMCTVDEFLIFSDGARVLIYDVTTGKIVLDEKRTMRGLCATPQNDVLVLSDNELVTLRLVKSNS